MVVIKETYVLKLVGAMVVTERLGLKCSTNTRSERTDISKAEVKKNIVIDSAQRLVQN